MLSIPLYFFLFLYLIFLCVFVVFSAVNAYHIVMSASLNVASFVVTLIIIILTILTLFFTWHALAGFDWKLPLVIFDSGWFN